MHPAVRPARRTAISGRHCRQIAQYAIDLRYCQLHSPPRLIEDAHLTIAISVCCGDKKAGCRQPAPVCKISFRLILPGLGHGANFDATVQLAARTSLVIRHRSGFAMPDSRDAISRHPLSDQIGLDRLGPPLRQLLIIGVDADAAGVPAGFQLRILILLANETTSFSFLIS